MPQSFAAVRKGRQISKAAKLRQAAVQLAGGDRASACGRGSEDQFSSCFPVVANLPRRGTLLRICGLSANGPARASVNRSQIAVACPKNFTHNTGASGDVSR